MLIKKLIDANALLENFKCCDIETSNDWYTIVEQLQEAPTIDAVEVVHGRWDFCEPDSAGNRKPKCSVCGKYYLAWWSDYTHCNFCPNCGADMRGDGNG